MYQEQDLTKEIIGAAIEVHRELDRDCSNRLTKLAFVMN